MFWQLSCVLAQCQGGYFFFFLLHIVDCVGERIIFFFSNMGCQHTLTVLPYITQLAYLVHTTMKVTEYELFQFTYAQFVLKEAQRILTDSLRKYSFVTTFFQLLSGDCATLSWCFLHEHYVFFCHIL